MNKKIIYSVAVAVVLVAVAVAAVLLVNSRKDKAFADSVPVVEPRLVYGINADDYTMEHGEIRPGENLSVLLNSFGVSPRRIDELSRKSQDVFDLRKIRGGNEYVVFLCNDTICPLSHFVYIHDVKNYVVFSFEGDSICVRKGMKEVSVTTHVQEIEIESSLWNAMAAKNLNTVLALDLSDVFAWSVDFYALQKGDKFRVLYDEEFVDSVSVGIGTIWGATFESGGKTHYAAFFDDGKDQHGYWDENGNSLKKAVLKAPLVYSRISSRFSNGRLHPILRIVRPHHGVDYSAPSGTPVVAVADGTVISRGWAGGGGNTVKIRHASMDMVTSYMHLKGFASGISAGARVHQGQTIGYVGSTGLSTGPHLDYRVYIKGAPVDPLKIPTTPGKPIAPTDKDEFLRRFAVVKDVLEGRTPADSLKTRIHLSDTVAALVPDTLSSMPGNGPR